MALYTVAERSRRYRKYNKASAVAAALRWQAKNPEKMKAYRLRRYRLDILRPEYVAKRNARARAYYAANREKCLAASRLQKAARPELEAARRVKKYGLTLAQFNEMLEKQGGCCAICKSDNPGGKGAFHVDHDHSTKKVRGILCHRCNTGLGLFRDDKSLLIDALKYLGLDG